MKNSAFISLSLFLLLVFMSSCKSSKEAKLVGEWMLIQIDGEDADMNVTMKFEEGGDFKGYKEGELVQEAKWEIKQNQLILKGGGEEITFKIDKLDRGVLILIEDLGEYGERVTEFTWVE